MIVKFEELYSLSRKMRNIEVTVMEYYYKERNAAGRLCSYVKYVLVPVYRKDKYETFGYKETQCIDQYAIDNMTLEEIYTERTYIQ